MNARTLETFDDSLRRCDTRPDFLNLFYELFLGSSPEVREKFASTDFERQKKALRSSFHLLLEAARDGDPRRHLQELAELHGSHRLDIGADLYDLWLDSLLEAVEECDPEYGSEVQAAWEAVMGLGIHYLVSHYRHPPSR